MENKHDPKDRPIVIRTPDHRLRVFVSSTLKELAEEREAVRQAILRLHLAPVMFESGARPHPSHELYQAYLVQSHVFIGIYWQSYGWISPGMQISGLEEEYNLSADMPRLIYIKDPAPNREPVLTDMLSRIQNENTVAFKFFTTPDELEELVENDLALMLTEHFETARSDEQVPIESTHHPLTDVPMPRNPLIGREHELAGACDLLTRDDVGLVTLTGAGGAGKSRLGIHIALHLRDHFKDGVYLVKLEPISDPNLVIPTIAETLGIRETPGGQPLAEMLKDYLRDKQILLLLDNFEQIVAAAPKIAELMETCPQVKFVVTSRAPLHLRSEKEFAVPPLAAPVLKQVPDLCCLSQYTAVELFVQRAQSIKSDFKVTNENAPAVAEICHRLDGLPLAIELAAARTRLLNPQALLTRLEHRFDVLRGGTRDLPERQRTLRGAIDWSYDLLDDTAKALFKRLSIFDDGWTLEAAEAICNLEGDLGPSVLEAIESLIDNSLLTQTQDTEGQIHFGMLSTIRDYANERLMESGEADHLRRRHAEYGLDFVKSRAAQPIS